jgi:radical SAM superfamily enzyme YgiQ (UPF0313 family)
MRVLLAYSNRTRILEPAPPIGLAYVATAARQAGHDVRFIDLLMSKDPLADLRDALLAFDPQVMGFSVRNIDNVIAQRTSLHLNEVRQMVETTRQHSKAIVVLGGPAASILGPTALERLGADFVIVGEGEASFPKLLAAIETGAGYEDVDGLCYKTGGRISSNLPKRAETFGKSGMENWVRWSGYERAGGTWAIHTKRGCPMSCVYCNYPAMEGHRLRRRAPVDIVDEIERVRRTARPRTFEFTDSTFNIPEDHAVEICEEIIRRNLRVNLSAVGMNPINVSKKLLLLMKRAGFRSLVITPDSASDIMLRALRKGFDAAQVEIAADIARKSGIRCTWFFLLGGPGETEATVEETVSFVEKHLNCSRFLTVILTGIRILPGTPLARLAMDEGCISREKDLCEPTFYFPRDLDENWVLGRINKAIGRCPGIVHGAEQPTSLTERLFNHALYWLGLPPPYYRFLPLFLRIPPLPVLRARNTDVRASCRKAGTGFVTGKSGAN